MKKKFYSLCLCAAVLLGSYAVHAVPRSEIPDNNTLRVDVSLQAPTHVTALALSPSHVRITFTDTNDEETGYIIYYASEPSSFNENDVISINPASVNGSVHTYDLELSSAEPSSLIYFKAQAYAGDNGDIISNELGPFSDVTSVVTLAGYPAGPSDFMAEQEGEAVRLYWIDNADDEGGFVIMRSTDSVNNNKLFNVPANVTTFLDTQVVPGVRYYYRLESVNEYGYGSDIVETDLTVYDIPETPVNLVAATGPLTSIQVAFTDNNTAESFYEVWHTSDLSMGSYVVLTIPAVSGSGNTITTYIKNYPHNTRVDVFVRAVIIHPGAPNTYSEFTGTVSAVTDDLPLSPTNITATPEGNGIRLNWTDNANNEAAFILVRYTGEYIPNVMPMALPADTETYFDAKPQPNETFTYRLQAVDVYENIPGHYFFAEGRYIETTIVKENLPETPTPLQASANGPYDIQYTFVDNSTFESVYEVYYSTVSANGPFQVEVAADSRTGAGDTLRGELGGFNPGTTVYLKVRALVLANNGKDTIAVGAFSAILSTMTLPLAGKQVLYLSTSLGLYHVNKDGTNLTKATKDGAYVMQASTGDLFGIDNGNRDGDTTYGGVFRITADGSTRLVNFDYAESSAATVVEGYSGTFYGTSPLGGCNSFKASLFTFRADGSGYNRLCRLQYFGPWSAMIASYDGYIVGVSTRGGAYGKGFDYRLQSSMSGLDTVHNFSGSDGKRPEGKLMQAQDGYLYGMAESGGNSNYGVIYRAHHLKDEFSVIHHFDKRNGAYPTGGLVEDADGFLYGVTPEGGSHRKGVIFRIKPDGTDYTVLHHYNGDGILPGNLTLVIDDEGDLYGLVNKSLFKIHRDGTGFTIIQALDMDQASPTGALLLIRQPYVPNIAVQYPTNNATDADLSLDISVNRVSRALSYTVELSKVPDFSTIQFTATAADTLLHIAGLEPETTYYARAKSSIWPFYGAVITFTTRAQQLRLWGNLEGIDSDGGIYHINLDGSDYVTAFQTSADNPDFQTSPKNLTWLSDGSIVGSTPYGGEHGWGNVFKIDANGLSNIHDWEEYAFGNTYFAENGDGYMYGVGPRAGQFTGRVIKSTLDGSNFQTAYFSKYGFYPAGYPVQATNGSVYGLSVGNGPGWLYKLKADNSGVDQLYTFSTPVGKFPSSDLAEGPDGYLYGVLKEGGAHYSGTIIKFHPDTHQLIKIHDFTEAAGRTPIGEVIFDDSNTLYGTTSRGGAFGKGVVYKMSINGTGFTVLHHNALGTGLEGHLALHEGILYVIGVGEGGFLFSVKTDGTEYHLMMDFPATNSATPQGRLLLIDETFNPVQPLVAVRGSQVAEVTQPEGKVLSVYPNPSANDFTVELKDRRREALLLDVYDMKGLRLQQSEGFTNQLNTVGKDLRPGVYMLRVEGHAKTYYQRIIKQ